MWERHLEFVRYDMIKVNDAYYGDAFLSACFSVRAVATLRGDWYSDKLLRLGGWRYSEGYFLGMWVCIGHQADLHRALLSMLDEALDFQVPKTSSRMLCEELLMAWHPQSIWLLQSTFQIEAGPNRKYLK